VSVVHAEGCRIYATDGSVYIDFLAGIAVNALGYSHPKIIEAVTTQAKKYMHVSNYFYQEPQVVLAEKLKKISGMDRVFLANSGTEANEGAIKLARRWGSKNGKSQMFGFSGGFHGRTYGALSLMDKPLFKDGMGPFLSNMHVLPFNDIGVLISSVDEDTCAVIIEFVQGEGGISIPEKEFIETLFELREKFGFLVIADEIQAGCGRTGKFFAFEHFGVSPDIITMAKALGGGIPLGAILAKEELANVWEKSMHGTTYGGNALACSAGLVVLNELENGLIEQVKEKGKYFISALSSAKSAHPKLITGIRGLGLILGLVLTFDSSILLNLLIEEKVIANATAGNILRIVPPLIVSMEEIDIFCEATMESIASVD